jgi:hypothetical protein
LQKVDACAEAPLLSTDGWQLSVLAAVGQPSMTDITQSEAVNRLNEVIGDLRMQEAFRSCASPGTRQGRRPGAS